jgi:8-oxo-dGTP pyrophosphatase MutT (NUDIX family)
MAYVTRERDGRTELLVFDQVGDPEAGTQVPAGRIDPGETLEEGLLRELHEEAGIDAAKVVRELSILGDWVRASPYEEHAFELRADPDLPESWDHVVHGDGEDAGMVFRFRWVHVDSEVNLWRGADVTYTQLR